MKDILLHLARKIRLRIIFIAAQNRFAARMYFLFVPNFDREYEYVLRGRYEALTSRYSSDFSNANLRRCIHRIEKGLTNKHPRKKFGHSVLLELSNEIDRLNNISNIDQNEIFWAIHTLESYLAHTEDPVRVKNCLMKLQALSTTMELASEQDSSNMDSATLNKLFNTRKSVRYYLPQKPNPSSIHRAVNMAKTAPSACNRQPFHLRLLEERSDIQYIGGMAPGTNGFLNNIPTLGVLIGHASAFRYSRDRHLIHLDGGLFLGHLLPALTSFNISTCVLNWTPDWKSDRAAIKYLKLDLSKTVICLLAMGIKDQTPTPTSIKKCSTTLLRI